MNLLNFIFSFQLRFWFLQLNFWWRFFNDFVKICLAFFVRKQSYLVFRNIFIRIMSFTLIHFDLSFDQISLTLWICHCYCLSLNKFIFHFLSLAILISKLYSNLLFRVIYFFYYLFGYCFNCLTFLICRFNCLCLREFVFNFICLGCLIGLWRYILFYFISLARLVWLFLRLVGFVI